MRFDWNSFNAIHGRNVNDEFELLSGMLVEHLETGKITNNPANYKGIESEPFKNKKGKKVAYQSKFFGNSSDSNKIAQFVNSLNKLTKEKIETIDILYLTTNNLGVGSQTNLESKLKNYFDSTGAKKPQIKFICGRQRFIGDLLKVKDFDTARAYFFGGGNPRNLHNSNIEDKIRELILKKQYVELEIKDTTSTYNSSKLLEEILKTDRANFLLEAGAGTGKSELLQKIAYDFAGLGKNNAEMMQTIIKNGIIIYLKASLCKDKSLSMFVSNILSSYGLSFTDYPITIILDGIDELPLDSSTSIISELHGLYRSGRVAKCISSVRLASTSATRYEQVMSPHLVRLQPINEDKIIEYFKKKNNKEKLQFLEEIIKNKGDLSEITDMRILELYWLNITQGLLPSRPQIFNAYFSSNIAHKKQGLNLLDPKQDSISLILESISVPTLLQGGRTIELSYVQKKILQLFPKMDYKDINEIIDLIASACGEKNNFEEGENFTFEHKSWIDYFSALYLTRKFRHSKKSLLDLVDYEDTLARWFVPVARYEFRKKGQLPESIAVGIIDSYLNFDSDREDPIDDLIIKIRISLNDESVREYVILYAEDLISRSIAITPKIIYEYFQAGYKDIAKRLFLLFDQKFRQEEDESEKNEYWKSARSDYWNNMNYYYLLDLKLSAKSPLELLKHFNEIFEYYASQGNWDLNRRLTDVVPSIYKVLVSAGITLEEIFSNMNESILEPSLEFIYSTETVRGIINNDSVKKSLSELVSKANLKDIDKFSLMSLAGVTVEQDLEVIKKLYETLNNDINTHFDKPILSLIKLFLIGKILKWNHEWDKEIENEKHFYSLKDIFDLFFSFATEKNFQSDYQDFELKLNRLLEKVDLYSSYRENFIRRAITELMSYLAQNITVSNTKKLIELNKNQGIQFYFFTSLLNLIFDTDKLLFKKLFKLNDVEEIVNSLRGNLESYTGELRDKVTLIAYLDPSKTPQLINELRRLTRLRYGYHKDLLGYFLTTALRIIWEKNYYSNDQKLYLTEKIYHSIKNIQTITDRDEIGHLPDEFFEILIENDFDLALKYFKIYSEDDYDMPILEQFNIAKVKRGENFKDIKHLLSSYRAQYMTQDKIFESYYEARFTLMVNVATSNIYSHDDRVEAIKIASNELLNLKKQNKEYCESDYRDGNFFSDAITNYRKIKKVLVADGSLESFPRPKSYPNANKEKAKKRKLSEYEKTDRKARKVFAKLPSLEAFKKIMKDISSNIYSPYNSEIVKSKRSVKLFIRSLENNKIELNKFSHVIELYLSEYFYRGESQYFIEKTWSSPFYKHQFIEYLYESKHHYDTNLLLRVLAKNNEKELVTGLIEQITDCIEMLSRKDS